MVDGETPLSARSVVLSTLLGTVPPRMSVRRLVAVGGLFGIGEGTIRTALTRMVQRGELAVSEGARYELSGALVARQARQSESRAATVDTWNGRWRMAVVTADGRATLRQAMQRLRFATQREGVWLRPDNLPADRLPDPMADASAQCSWYVANPTDDDSELAASLWDLDGWASRTHALPSAARCTGSSNERKAAWFFAPAYSLSAWPKG